MPLVGANQDAGGIIDAVSIIKDGSNGNGNLTDRINEIKNLPENRLSLNFYRIWLALEMKNKLNWHRNC